MGLLADTAKRTGLDTPKKAADDTLLALAMAFCPVYVPPFF